MKAKDKQKLSLKERLLQQYSNYLRTCNYSTSTYKSYMGTVRNFWEWCEAQRQDSSFDKANAVQAYLAYRIHDCGLDFSTVNGDYSALQWFYKQVKH